MQHDNGLTPHRHTQRRHRLGSTVLAMTMACAASAVGGVIITTSVAAEDAPESSEYVALNPFRVFDTRMAHNAPLGPVPGDSTFDVQITGGAIPDAATAVVVNVTYVDAVGPGYVAVYPTGGEQPVVSNLNKVGPGPVPNLATVKLGVGGRISLFNQGGAVNLLGDVAGYFISVAGSGAPGPAGPPGSGLPGTSCTVGGRTGTVGYDPLRANLECQSGVVGNMQVDLGEECDNGNTLSGDGCDSTGHIEPPLVLHSASGIGPIVESFGPTGGNWIFIGPTDTVVVNAGDRLVGSGTASIGLPSINTAYVDVSMCYRLTQTAPVQSFAGDPYVTFFVNEIQQSMAAAARTTAFPTATTITVGFCVRANVVVNRNDFVSWYVQAVRS